MRALQVVRPGRMEIVDREKPDITRGDEVRIKVKMVGICGSDMHIYHGTNPFATYPRVIGHEVAGVVDEVGNEVKGLAPWDMVVIEPIETCGECYACRTGRRNVCTRLEVYGVHRDGGMQDYLVMPERLVHKVSSALQWTEAVLVEPFTIGAQANWRGNVQKGDVVFIMGAGPIGLCCLNIAKIRGATCIISDLSDARLEFAKKWGADYTLNAAGMDVREKVGRMTGGMGANVVIDAVCIPKTFEDAVEIASVAGRVVTLGFDGRPSQIPQLSITKKELTVAGSRLQTDQFAYVIQLMNERKLLPDGMVTHQFPLEKMEEAVKLIETQPELVRKVVVTL